MTLTKFVKKQKIQANRQLEYEMSGNVWFGKVDENSFWLEVYI